MYGMKRYVRLGLILLMSSIALAPGRASSQEVREGTPPNTLSREEKGEGWQLLFDGRTLSGWRCEDRDSLPSKGWKIADGALMVEASVGGGNIVTAGEYSSFELEVDFRLTRGANSGIMYFVPDLGAGTSPSSRSLEYQLLDDSVHRDAKLGIAGNRTLASLYDLLPAEGKRTHPVGEWNHARIVVRGAHVEHWLNGRKVLEFERGGREFLAHKAASKFRDLNGFGEAGKGHILLQDHGDQVFFRNIRIRTFSRGPLK